MNLLPPPTARRAIRNHLGSPLVLGSMAGMSVVLALSGPFDTLALMGMPARLVYWTVLVFGVYATGTVITDTLNPQLRPGRLGYGGTAIITGTLNGIIAGTIVILLNAWLFDARPRPLASPAAALGFCLLVALVVNGLHALSEYRNRNRETTGTGTDQRAGVAPLVERLQPDRRGELVALRVQDHYVEVTTTGGQDMLLMRLRDAIRETAPEPGLQVHRSHWVAAAHVRASQLHGETATLILSDGRSVPVSRTYLPAVTAAGLLRGDTSPAS